MTAVAPPPGKRPELEALTGLRAWAALWVVIHHHMVFVEGELGEPWYGLLHRGYLGVDVFFALSGFVLAYNYGGRLRSGAEALRFMALRWARLYPLHLVTLTLVSLVAWTSPWTGLEPGNASRYAIDYHLVLHLLMMHAWGFEESLRFNQPSWSISAEFFAYLCFPVWWAVVERIRGPVLAAVAAAAAGLGTIGALRLLGHDTLHVPLDHALVRVSGEFLAGCLAYRAMETAQGLPIPPRATASLLLAALALAASPWADPWMAPGATFLVFVLAAGSGPALRPFTAAPVRFLGRISYSIYLTHLPVMSALHRVLPSWELGALPVPQTVLLLLAHAAAIVGVAALSYQWVELPAREAIRRRIAPTARG